MGITTKKEIGFFSLFQKFQSVLFLLILSLVLLQPVSILYQGKNTLLSGDYTGRYELYKNLYYNSQYIKKNNPSIIPDEVLESFAGGIFLRGINPILIVHDQPPLGRYIIALSILLFDNPHTIVILLLFLSGIAVFLIARHITKNNILSLIPVGIFINEPLFITKITTGPLLEPIQLPFILYALYFFLRALESKKYFYWFFLTVIMLGFIISIRFFVLGAAITSIMVLYFFVYKEFNKKFLAFLFLLPLSLVVLIASYLKTLQSGYSIIQIFGIQKYILFYHKSKFILPFSFWDLILFNRWHTWWGNMSITSDVHWIIVWPIAYFTICICIIYLLMKKIIFNKSEVLVLLWILVYSLMLSAGYTSTRYFLPLLPFLYILAVSLIFRIVKDILRKHG